MKQPSKEEPISVIACDLNGVVTAYEGGAQELFGWRPDEVVGKMSVAAFHKPEMVATLVPRLLKTAVETGEFEEDVVLRHKDGREFPARLTVRPQYHEGKQVGFMGMTRRLDQ